MIKFLALDHHSGVRNKAQLTKSQMMIQYLYLSPPTSSSAINCQKSSQRYRINHNDLDENDYPDEIPNHHFVRWYLFLPPSLSSPSRLG